MNWSEVDPTTISFDERVAYDAAHEVLRLRLGERPYDAVLASNPDLPTLQTALKAAIALEVGEWAYGWLWGAYDGGPSRAWCCPAHSLLRKGDSGIEDTARRAAAAVTEWYRYLGELRGIFEELAPIRANDAASVESAAERLLLHAVERTELEDAWYHTFVQILSWALEFHGIAQPEISTAIRDIVGGEFTSWAEPAESTATSVIRKVARVVEDLGRVHTTELPPVDGIREWRKQRSQFEQTWFREPEFWAAKFRSSFDGHRRFIDSRDAARSVERADRMRAALKACRTYADGQAPLSWDTLVEWQQLVLGRPVGFREGDAFAKAGREIYRMNEGLEAEFSACVDQANEPDLACVLKAARVYLDICFYHPFEDGNARSARLAMDFVLRRGGLSLLDPAPVFLLPRRADSKPYFFARTVWAVSARSRRRREFPGRG